MLLASCAIHAADDDRKMDPSTPTTSTHTTDVQLNRSTNENTSPLETLPPEILDYILAKLDLRSFQMLSQTSHRLQAEIFGIHCLSDNQKKEANESISKMFDNHFFVGNKTSIGDLIKNAFAANNITCINAYKSCAAMREFPSNEEISNLVYNFPNRPWAIFSIAIYYKHFPHWTIRALVPLSVENINAIGAHASQLLLGIMNGFDRHHIINALARLSDEKINAICTHAS